MKARQRLIDVILRCDSVGHKDYADNAVALREIDAICEITYKWLEMQGLANESARIYDELKRLGYEQPNPDKVKETERG